MADAQANINVNVNTADALAQIRALQRQLSNFYSEMAKGGAGASVQMANMQQNLINSVNATGKFSASMTTVRSTAEGFTNALEKNKLSLGQYFRFAGGASQTFGKLFKSEFDTINKVARERVKTLQTQFIRLGRDANGAMQAIKVRPLALDMENLGTKVQMTAQRQQLFNQLVKQGSTNLLNFGKNTQWAGRQLMVGFTIPLMLFGTAATRAFQKIEEQAIKFRRVYGDMFTTTADTEKALKNVRELADEFTKYGIAVEKTMDLAAKVAQMGNVGKALEEQVTQATRLSVLGGMEQMDALDTTISLTNAFGIEIEDLSKKIDFLNAAENQTILAIEDFNTAIPLTGTVVNELGGSIEDLAVLLTAMREAGINASQGGNALKSSLARLIAPSKAAQQRLSEMGINVMGIVESNAGDLMGTVMSLGRELDKLDPLSRARAIEALFGKFQFARMSALFQNITKEGSQANKVLALTQATSEELAVLSRRELGRVEESAATKFQKTLEQIQAALAPIGEEFLKAITPIVEFATKLLKQFNNLSDGTKQFVTNIVGFVGLVAPVFLMGLGLVFNLIANGIKAFQFLGKVLLGLSGKSRILGGGLDYLNQEQIEGLSAAGSLEQAHIRLQQIFTSEESAVRRLIDAYRAAVIAQQGFSGPAATSRLITAPGFAGGKMVPGYSKGKSVPGYANGVFTVPGRTSDGDAQPAMLTAGEAVISEPMTRKYGALINAMISDNIPGYARSKSAPGDIIGGPFNYRQYSRAAMMGPQAGYAEPMNMDWLRTRPEAKVSAASAIKLDVSKQSGTPYESSVSPEGQEAVDYAGTLLQKHAQNTESFSTAAKNAYDEFLEYLKRQVAAGKLSAEESERIAKSARAVLDPIQEDLTEVSIPRQGIEQRGDGFVAGKLRSERVGPSNSSAAVAAYEKELVLAGMDPSLATAPISINGKNYPKPTFAHTQESLPMTAEEAAARGIDTTPRLRQKSLRTPPELDLLSRKTAGEVVPRGTPLASEIDIDAIQKEGVEQFNQLGRLLVRGQAEGVQEEGEMASPSKKFFRLGQNLVQGMANGVEEKTQEVTGSGAPPPPPPPSGSPLAPPPPPQAPPVAPPSRGKKIANRILDSGPSKFVGKKLAQMSGIAVSDSKGEVFYDPNEDESTEFGKMTAAARKQRDSLPGGKDYVPPDPNAPPPPSAVARQINTELRDKGYITDSLEQTPLGVASGIVPVKVVDGKVDIGDNSIDNLANVSPTANEAAEAGEVTQAAKDNRAATEKATEATENLAKTTASSDKTAEQIAKETKRENARQNRQKRSGMALRGLGAATMAVGVASQMTGVEMFGINIGEAAQKIMPFIGALTAIVPILLALSGPVAILVAVIGAGVAAWILYNKKLKEVTDNARQLAESLGSGSKAMSRFAEFAGTVTPTEIMNERRQLGSIDVALGKSEFGEQFVASEQGQEFTKALEDGIEKIGRSETMKKLGVQLATAVSSNVLTTEQAAGIAAEVGRALGDLSISMDLLGNLTALIGPGGQDLLTSPLEVFMRVIDISAQDTEKSINDLMSEILDPDATNNFGFFSGLFDVPELQAKLAGDVVALQEQVQGQLDAQTLAHEANIAKYKEENALLEAQAKTLEEQGRTGEAEEKRAGIATNSAEIAKLENSYLEDRAALLEKARGVNSQIFDQQAKAQALQETVAEIGDIYTFTGNGGDIETVRNFLKDFSDFTGTELEVDLSSASPADLRKEYVRLNSEIKGVDKVAEGFQGTLDQMGVLVAGRLEDDDPNRRLIEEFTKDTEVDFKVRFNLVQGLATGGIDISQVTKFLDEFPVKAKQVVGNTELIAEKRKELTRAARSPVEAEMYAALTDEQVAQKIIENNKKIQESFSGIVSGLGQGASQQLMNIFDKIEGPELKEDIVSKISLLVEGGKPEELERAQDMLDMFSMISSYGENTIDRDATMAFYLENPDAFTDFKSQMSEFDGLTEKYGEDLTAEVVFSNMFIADSDQYNAFKSQASYFDSLPANQRKVFVSTFITQFATIGGMEGTEAGTAAFETYKAEKIAGLGSGDTDSALENIKNMTYDDFVAASALEAAKKVTNALITAGIIDELEIEDESKSGGQKEGFDNLLKRLRDVRLATIDMKRGWEGMQESLQKVFKGGNNPLKVFDGLSNQIRRLGVGESLIDLIVGMDPDEYEKRKNELFVFDKDGNIKDTTDALKNMQAALRAIAIGDFVNSQEKFIKNTNDQIEAVRILTANGLSYAEALEAVQDQELATAIAMGATQEEIAKTISLMQEANRMRGRLEAMQERASASKALQKTNEEFQNRINLLDKLAKSTTKYSDAQIDAIMGDANLAKIFLDPSIDPGALTQALADAERKANLELNIRKLTISGTRGVFEEGFSQAMDWFSRNEQALQIKLQLEIEEDEGAIRDAQSQISDLQFELDDYQAELERISWREEEINDAYEKRFEALDKIAGANEAIAEAQKSQLDIADALTRGDIAAAARAAQEARSQQADRAATSEREQLERARDAQIANLTGRTGLIREELEDRIKILERLIFDIEEDQLEPAQERIRLAQEVMDAEVRSLEVLGKTRNQWEAIKNGIDMAEASGYKFKEIMQEALDVVEKLMNAYPKAPPPPPPPPPPPALVEPSGAPIIVIPTNPEWSAWRESLGLSVAEAERQGGGPARRLAMGGMVKRYAGGGMIVPKRMASGGFALGSDIVPAMLTPGEFVVRRPAVRGFGVDNLEKINNGTYADGSVYTYNLAVNVKSNSDPDRIARTVMKHIERVDSQKIRGNRI